MNLFAMLQTASALFGLAALGGLVMAVMRLRGAPHPPIWLAMGHGFLAAAGLTLLLYAACAVGVPPLAQLATALLLIAAVGGAAMNLLFHWRQRALPIPLMIGHAALAVAGYALLLWVVFGATRAL